MTAVAIFGVDMLALRNVAAGHRNAVRNRYPLMVQPAGTAIGCHCFGFLFHRLVRFGGLRAFFEKPVVAAGGKQIAEFPSDGGVLGFPDQLCGTAIGADANEVPDGVVGVAFRLQNVKCIQTAIHDGAKGVLRLPGRQHALAQTVAQHRQQREKGHDDGAGACCGPEIDGTPFGKFAVRFRRADADNRNQGEILQLPVAEHARNLPRAAGGDHVMVSCRSRGNGRQRLARVVRHQHPIADAHRAKRAVVPQQADRTVGAEVGAIVEIGQIGGRQRDHDDAGKRAVGVVEPAA